MYLQVWLYRLILISLSENSQLGWFPSILKSIAQYPPQNEMSALELKQITELELKWRFAFQVKILTGFWCLI